VARADLILNLARAGSQGDQLGVRRTLEAMVADERGKQHHVVAEQLSEVLSLSQRIAAPTKGAPAESAGSPLLELIPHRTLADMVLPAAARQAVEELIEEQHRADVLRAHGLEPRNRVLLVGAPGNGKTSLAEAVAGELSLPLLVVKYESVIGSYLGETALRLARMFEQVRSRRCVLFFDEFDAIGKERGDKHETGEIKRVVSSLLLNVDSLPAYVVTMAATNHAELLDRAIWRRFQVRLDLPPPDISAILEWLARFENNSGLPLGIAKKTTAQQLKGLSFAELDDLCGDILRRTALAGPSADLRKIVRSRLDQWRARAAVRR
jgi:SpoVK/Ycf46/Vps4 family AAA+-type ATPase